MENRNPLQSKENKQNKIKANILFLGFVLILAFVYVVMGAIKVGAVEATITGTEYIKDGTAQDFDKVDLTNGNSKLTFIQGNGNNNEVALKFTLSDFPSNATSFMIVESEHSDSSSTADADRYSKNLAGVWVASSSNQEINEVKTGSATFSTGEDGKITADIVYMLRKGSFGLNFLKVFFYEASVTTGTPSSSIEVFYMISQPIDTVQQGTTCTGKSTTTICIDYVSGSATRESRDLKIYIPETVAYIFKALNNGETAEFISSNYGVQEHSTIYAINYFREDSGGVVNTVTDKENANRNYLYTRFSKQGDDSQAVVDDLIVNKNALYLNYLDTLANKVDFLTMKVDSTGSYFFYITDIFGNVKEIKQDVTDVKNRSIITEIKKSNAENIGYDAAETFTNESVAVTIKMTVATNFEFGMCINDKCTEIINLTEDNVKQIKYWRVDITVQNGVDIDAFIPGDPVSKNYASEDYAAGRNTYNLYCGEASVCAEVQTYSAANINNEDGAGYSLFNDNVLTMFVATSGRYRFYIEDVYGNNTWGTESDRVIEEYRNPRVEVYAIDKSAPEITFDYTDVKNVNGSDLKMFDIDTYDYYRGIELAKNDGKFVYDARITGTEAVEGIIENQIYYPATVDNGRALDVYFSNTMATSLSKVRASEYVYYYTGAKDLLADYSTYDRENGSYYVVTNYDNNRANTISRNTKNNSNGLLLNLGNFSFEIAYYHNDGVNRVCKQITDSGVEGYSDELRCVNYYLDHGVDFIIEFTATDFVGNISSNRVYVNVIDTTPAGFTAYRDTTNAIKSSNVGTNCRMEIGSEIGLGKTQNKRAMLNCYNVILNTTTNVSNDVYNFEDNVYDINTNNGLSYANRINSNSFVKLYVLADDGETWIDLETNTFIPNKTGYYSLKIELHDATINQTGTNVLTVMVSYYVDRKIVLIEPLANEKFYGTDDVTFNYCVYIDTNNRFDIRFSSNPYSDPTIYTRIYCTNYTSEQITTGKNQLFQQNTTSDFGGALSRLESIWYNQNLTSPILFGDTGVGVENNYVGLYRMILGTLNINVYSNEGAFVEVDNDYIVKIHPSFRDDTKYNGSENDNLVTNKPLEDDDPYAQSSVDFTIKQIVAEVTSIGGEKKYGELDTNYGSYNNDSASDKYLNGFNVTGLISGGQYSDTIDIILGVLRREVGENVGIYSICNYRGTIIGENTTLNDTDLEAVNNMYLNCQDSQTSGITFSDTDTYNFVNGILVMNSDYIRSRALYVSTNKETTGRTLNATTDSRDNAHANYVINYVASTYKINPIDLVLQAAPGQRREYNFTNSNDPNPWEIILYGLVDGSIKRTTDATFNGFTANIIDGDYYGASPNDSSDAATIAANYSENRENWYLYHNGSQLTGYKTNETYQLLRSVTLGSTAGSAKLVREGGSNGGWYLYKELSNDLNISEISAGVSGNSDIAVVTNIKNNCSYDSTGHMVSVNGTNPCKNYNLIYNPYYTNSDGYTIEEHPDSVNDLEFVYKSNGLSCETLDSELPCTNTETETQKIYKILFEIYRREIILEFNSAIEEIKTVTTVDETSTIINVDTVYGQRYNFYNTNFFDINYYTGKTFYPEDYLFVCYNGSERSDFDPTNSSSTGCTGNYRYGLTAGDSWVNLGLTFKMHDLISSNGSAYYDNDDLAIPAGVYYVYADIAAEQKVNYNFKYSGGTMTIKSLPVDIIITSFLKEYGEAYYSKYGNGTDYASFTDFTRNCLMDGQIINSSDSLISLAEGVYCGDANSDVGNTKENIYGFYINGLDVRDTIASNFLGRPHRDRSVSLAGDTNGLQDNVGIYAVTKGSIATINNNPFKTANACSSQVLKGEINDCVVVAGKEINNYVVYGEEREYKFDMVGIADVNKEKEYPVDTPTVNGSVIIIPATLKITVTGGQTKMYGCAYNGVNTSINSLKYSYASGYSSDCVQGDGNYFDLGYVYTVADDKDYQIANSGFETTYTSTVTYTVSGIPGSSYFRPSVENQIGIKSHALNNDGVLYRIEDTADNRAGISNNLIYASSAVNASFSTDTRAKTYQKQTVGNYIITLGSVDAAVNANHANIVNTCDQNNMPVEGGTYACKNYHIDYHGTKSYNIPNGTESNRPQFYGGSTDAFPTEILFTITKRKAYVYTNYDQKIYGDADQDVSYMCGDYNNDGFINENDNVNGINGDIYYGHCTAAQVSANTDTEAGNNVEINYGLTRYYTKYNSLAKYPWNGIDDRNIDDRNDVQTDVIEGKISRKGMSDNAPAINDIRGFYEYVYNNSNFGATVALNEYGSANYEVNFYNDDGLAVNADGNTANSDDTLIKFEIVLRQIKIGFASFTKVYGEHDVVTDYNILVCAPSETFDFTTMKCTGKSSSDRHGLSAAHLATYMNEDGTLKQELFKSDFIVRFKRVFGENVSCGTSPTVTVTLLSGFFFGDTGVTNDGTSFTIELSCKDTDYETLAYIDQKESTYPGYNYQVSYTTGYVDITPRPILITPDEGQGFTYGDYHDTLIPHISYSVSRNNTSLKQSYGLVHDESSTAGICLKNIDYYNNGENAGTCFNINDRIDEYNIGSSKTFISSFAGVVTSDKGLSLLENINYIFGDVYTSEGSTRSALNRKSDTIETATNERYNRNVGVYTIVLGDLKEKTQVNNYTITFTEDVKYEIKPATIKITPEATVYEGTDQENQYKIYGEQDKELTFTILITYTVANTHYAKYNVAIDEVCSSQNVCVSGNNLVRVAYDSSNDTFTENSNGEYFRLNQGDVVTLKGFAYGENNGNYDSNTNYGVSKEKEIGKTEEESVDQTSVTGAKYYDIACNGGVGCEEGTITVDGEEVPTTILSYETTSRILLGYLYVDKYSQAAGTYNIMNGFVVANNELSYKNYVIDFVQDIKFTIIPRPVGVQIQNVVKTYGQATDKISCENAAPENCAVQDGILDEDSEDLLKYNFLTEWFSGSTRIDEILESNNILYVQNSTFINGLVTASDYSVYGVEENKNSAHLGVYVSRDEKNKNNDTCMYADDIFGFCEDVGEYYLRFYGYYNTIDNITEDSYNTVYKPGTPSYTGKVESVSTYYYDSYWGYNPNYFVIVVESDTVAEVETDEVAVVSPFVDSAVSTSRTSSDKNEKLLKATGTLTINPKDVKLYVNTAFYGENPEIYYIQQNTNPPSLPTLNNDYNLNYENFDKVDESDPTAGRQPSVGGASTYGNIIWGLHPSQVRTGDKLVGALAYCNVIIETETYAGLLETGITRDYTCSNLLYEDNKNNLNTNLTGYVPIVRDINSLSIVNQSTTAATPGYENKNYTVTFYPGGLRIEADDIKPVSEVNREHVYIEANAIGTYAYECVGKYNTTTYVGDPSDDDCKDISIVGKTELTSGDPILDWLNKTEEGIENISLIVKVDLPTIEECQSNEHPCTSSAYYQSVYGKGKNGFRDSGGIVAGEENSLIYPFTMQKADYIKNSGPTSLKEFIITLVDWFGVTAYDEGEIRNGQILDKDFDKYWYIVIEKSGTNGDFAIDKVGEYKVHFYVMDNAGNVSEGNMRTEGTLEATYNNVGTLHIIDTTKPVVGNLNLYNGRVECLGNDCTSEDNWAVAEDTYVAINTLGRYDSGGNPSSSGGYVIIDNSSQPVLLSSIQKYNISTSDSGDITYVADSTLGKYIRIAKGTKAIALKHYSWSNSVKGVWFTITGGSDNSYTETSFTNGVSDYSQWNHYFSRDGGVTWFLYERTNKSGYLALDSEGTREIMIKAVDIGVKIETAIGTSSTYTDRYYGQGNSNNNTTTMSKYNFTDSSTHDAWLKGFEAMTNEQQTANEETRHSEIAKVGWNISDWAEEDKVKANVISLLIYGKGTSGTEGVVDGTNYVFYRDRQTAYLDRTKPIIEFGDINGEKLYVYEYGCTICTRGYTEYYAGATDSYPANYKSGEIASSAFNKNNSILINHNIYVSAGIGNYQGDYTSINQETLNTVNSVGGLGSDQFAMNGTNTGQDIRNIYNQERRYIIYSFTGSTRVQHDLSTSIPTTATTTADGYSSAEEEIYDIIEKSLENYTGGDVTYTIVYSVIDKAGNESIYIARGVIFAKLVPTIVPVSNLYAMSNTDNSTYYLNVRTGDDVSEIVESLSMEAGNREYYLTQTVYYNGELVVDNKRYDPLIYDGFNTNSPGVYEITYNLEFRYYQNGQSEMITADPVKLVINVEASPPIVNESRNMNYSNIILLISLMLSGMFIGFVVIKKKKSS